MPKWLWKLLVLRSRVLASFQIAVRAPFVYENWLYFLLCRFTRDNGLLRLRKGLRFWIRPRSSDRASITEIQMFRPYSQPAPGSVVLDIGANIGAFALQASQTASKVYAVEPIQSNYEMLCRNVAANSCKTVVPIRVAVAAQTGSSEMSVNGVTSSLKWQESGTRSETVPTVTLAALLQSFGPAAFDYVKMDCEGAEWEILLQTPDEVFSSIRRIELEYHCFPGCPPPSVLADRLRAIGFGSVTMSGNSSAGIIAAKEFCGATDRSQLHSGHIAPEQVP